MGNSGGAKAAGLLILGSVIMVIGPLLTFITLKGPGGEESVTGYDLEEGSPYILAAVVCGLMGILLFVVKGATGRKVLGGIALLGALFGGYAGFVDLTGDVEGLPASVDSSSGLGTWVVLLGAVLALIGAIIALTSPADTSTGPLAPTGPPPAAPPPAGPPPA